MYRSYELLYCDAFLMSSIQVFCIPAIRPYLSGELSKSRFFGLFLSGLHLLGYVDSNLGFGSALSCMLIAFLYGPLSIKPPVRSLLFSRI